MPILRDDDIFLTEHPCTGRQLYDLDQFMRVHEMLAGRTHTIGIIASEIANHGELAEYIESQRNIEVALHGWTHVKHDTWKRDDCIASIQRGISAIGYHFGRKPTWFFPPWNATSPQLEDAVHLVGMKLDSSGLTPQRWLAGGRGPVLSFHYYNQAEVDALRECVERDLI